MWNVSALSETTGDDPPRWAGPGTKERAAVGGAGDDVTVPPYGPGGDEPQFATNFAGGASQDLPPTPSASPLALAAFIVCIAAFVLGLVPILGAVLALVGILLVVLAARRGLTSKRTYAGAAAAVVGGLASIAMSVALIALVTAPDVPSTPEPTIAAEETDGSDYDAEAGPATTAPADDEETTPEAEPVEEKVPVTDEDPVTAAPTDPEPSEEPSPAPTASADLSAYEELDERNLAQIVKAPDDHIGRQVVVYGAITQLDAATGKCFVRLSIAHAPQEAWYDYEHNPVDFAGDGESVCPVLDPLVADGEVKLWITIGGSISYDTQIGDSTTVPAYLIDDAELL